jgi:hypothetical protein
MRANREYQICKDIAIYMRLQYPKVLFHFDLAGLNLSRAQAGMMKAIQGGRGWPDLFIAQPNHGYFGMFMEVKKEDTRLYKCSDNSKGTTPHIIEQIECILNLDNKGYYSSFGIGFDNCKRIIDEYLSNYLKHKT